MLCLNLQLSQSLDREALARAGGHGRHHTPGAHTPVVVVAAAVVVVAAAVVWVGVGICVAADPQAALGGVQVVAGAGCAVGRHRQRLER